MAAVLWWPLAAWLSPATAWFIFFNAVVATIAIMSSDAHRADAGARTAAARRGLCRSGSSMVLDRLRSFSIFAVHPAAATAAPTGDDDGATAAASSESSHFYCYGTREAEEAAEAAATMQARARGQPHRIQKQAVAAPPAATATSGAVPLPSAPVALERAEEDPAAAPVVTPAPENDEEHNKAEPEPEAEEAQDESISLDEAYALARRLRAQELASPPSPPPAPATATATMARTKKPAKKVVAAEGVTRRRAKAGEALEGKAELNARAELFIRQFREELKLQRLNSILGHTHALRSPTAAR